VPSLPETEIEISIGDIHLPRVALLVGSLRVESLNMAFAREARDVLSEQADVEIAVPDLPLFSQDYERPDAEPTSPAGRAFRKKMRRADAVLVVSPEYDRLPSAVTLNACHWMSREPLRPLRDTPVMLAGVSSGSGATRASRPALRLALERIGARVLEDEFFVSADALGSDELRAELRQKLPGLLRR
jgi:chromate reductase